MHMSHKLFPNNTSCFTKNCLAFISSKLVKTIFSMEACFWLHIIYWEMSNIWFISMFSKMFYSIIFTPILTEEQIKCRFFLDSCIGMSRWPKSTKSEWQLSVICSSIKLMWWTFSFLCISNQINYDPEIDPFSSWYGTICILSVYLNSCACNISFENKMLSRPMLITLILLYHSFGFSSISSSSSG